MSADAGIAVALGSVLGLGLWALAMLLPPLRRPQLADRIAPYVADISPVAREQSGRRSTDPLPVVAALLVPVLRALRWILGLVGADQGLVLRRLGQSGGPALEQYRLSQLLWALGAFAASTALAVVVYATGRLPLPVAALLPLFGAVFGIVLRDQALARAARRRVARIEEELPTVLEFLSLSLAAGEAITDALDRVARVSAGGELGGEFRRVMAEVSTGIPFPVALREFEHRLSMPVLARCVDQILGALERGTPVAAVLLDHAHDGRDRAKRRLLESAGKKEVAMLVPLVFLILPLSIIIAVFPGAFVLRTGF
ncbi:type II secretion system F family protein [Plantibacter flavus]|uniref:type II secretion system F family protein n=1 Tax=Plantibacter flavus TaxID=150123 RepID=UPI003F13A605